MNKTIILLVIVLNSSVLFAEEHWTTWRKSPNILSIAFEDSIIWCGTEGKGVITYNRMTGEQQYFTTENGLSDNTVTDIVIDRNGVKWFVTSTGFISF